MLQKHKYTDRAHLRVNTNTRLPERHPRPLFWIFKCREESMSLMGRCFNR